MVEAERLNGALTNQSYKVTTEGGVYVLRLAGEGTSGFIDRAAEGHNARVAAATGVNAGMLYFDAKAGTMLTRFVGGVPMDGETARNDPAAVSRAVLALRRVHGLGRVFRSRFDVFARLDGYLDLLFEMGTPPPSDYFEVWRETEAIRQALEANPANLAPCHNDPWPGNLLDTGDRVYIIDWEYSGMNDPAWDLADFAVEAGLEPDAERAMLETYLGVPPPPTLLSRLALYKAMSDLHWSLWAIVQHANGNTSEDFQAYALARLKGFENQVGGPDFGHHLNVVLTGRHSPSRPYRGGRWRLPWRLAPNHG